MMVFVERPYIVSTDFFDSLDSIELAPPLLNVYRRLNLAETVEEEDEKHTLLNNWWRYHVHVGGGG